MQQPTKKLDTINTLIYTIYKVSYTKRPIWVHVIQKGQFECPIRKLRNPKETVVLSGFLGILPGIRQKSVQWQQLFNGNNGSALVASFCSQAKQPGHKLLPLREFKKTVFSSSELLSKTSLQIFKTSLDRSHLTWVQFKTRIRNTDANICTAKTLYSYETAALCGKDDGERHSFPFPDAIPLSIHNHLSSV